MNNKVFINKSELIEQMYVGDQTGDSVDQTLVKRTNPLIAQLKQRRKRILVLINLTKIGTPNASARLVAVNALKQLEYEKIAVYTDNLYIKYVAGFVIKASGRFNDVRTFDDRRNAIKWLNEM